MSLRKFESLTPAGKRIRIARDVLANLDAKKFAAEQSRYVLLYNKPIPALESAERTAEPIDSGPAAVPRTQVVSRFKRTADTCRVCALGSLLLCKLDYKNGTTYEEVWGSQRSGVVENLKDYFDVNQLGLIELVFEGNDYSRGGYTGDASVAYNHRAAIVGSRHDILSSDKSDLLLRDIMHNIIAHKGTFVPTGKPTPAPVRGKNQHSKKTTVTPPKPVWTLETWAAEVDRRNAAGVELTEQEMFNRAWIGLKLQGFKRCSVDESDSGCKYKIDNTHCAWGWVDPAGTADSLVAYGSVYGLVTRQTGVAAQLPSDPAGPRLFFAMKLQRAHDLPSGYDRPDGYTPEAVEASLRGLAKKFNLTIPEE